MATYNRTGTGSDTNGVISFGSLNRVYTLSNVIDLTKDTMVANDVYQCLAIPADTLVMQVRVEVIAPAVGTALAANVGDGGAANGWDAAIDLKAAAGTFYHSVFGTDARAVANNLGYFYDDADSIDITLSTVTAITKGPIIRITALCADFNS